MTDIQKVEGIAYEHAKELSKAGVLTTEDLLREGPLPRAGRILNMSQGSPTS